MPRNLSLMLMDIDWSKSMPSHFLLKTAQDVWNTLVMLFPLLAYVSILIRPSSSSGIYNTVTGAVRSMFDSWHVYIVIYNSTAETNKNFVEFLKRRAWLPDVNLGYVTLNGAGVCERYFNDLAVHSAERLIVEPTPILEAPLAKKNIQSVVFEGGALDLASIDYNLEPDYREIYAQEKAKLIATIPTTDKTVTASRIQAVASVQPTEASHPNEIQISASTKDEIKAIYNLFQENKMPSTADLKKFLTADLVRTILIFLGFTVDHNFKFKLRNEKTASASISYSGFIKDFGGDFSGNIIDFFIQIYNMEFKESWAYIKNLFGMHVQFPRPFPPALPNPRDFEKCLLIQKNNLIGKI